MICSDDLVVVLFVFALLFVSINRSNTIPPSDHYYFDLSINSKFDLKFPAYPRSQGNIKNLLACCS